jgi:hypothetical protein
MTNTTQDSEKDYQELKQFFIAGVQFHELKTIIDKLEVGNYLQLTPEPTNKFDPNAIRIECFTADGDIMCGYVPKKFSSEIAALISIGTNLECEITELNKNAKPWEQCKVVIKEVLYCLKLN